MGGHKRRIPGRAEWIGYEHDLDVKYAYKLLFGKSSAEVQQYFGGVHSIERADELLYMPRLAFQYYVFSFAEFVTSPEAVGDPDSASPFLRLLNREQRDAGSVSEIYTELLPMVQYIASHRDTYDANPDIYGSFEDLASQLEVACLRRVPRT